MSFITSQNQSFASPHDVYIHFPDHIRVESLVNNPISSVKQHKACVGGDRENFNCTRSDHSLPRWTKRAVRGGWKHHHWIIRGQKCGVLISVRNEPFHLPKVVLQLNGLSRHGFQSILAIQPNRVLLASCECVNGINVNLARILSFRLLHFVEGRPERLGRFEPCELFTSTVDISSSIR